MFEDHLTELFAIRSIFVVTKGDFGFVKPTSAYPWSSVKLHRRHHLV